MALFFTADQHFGHFPILRSCARPFPDVPAMNAALVEAWNSVVGPDDDVYHLGDFAYKARRADLAAIFDSLNGNKYLLKGNHDHRDVLRLPWKGFLPAIHEMEHEGEMLVLSHYPMRSWNKSRYGARNLFGHVHGRIPMTRQSIDVGVDSHGYAPVPLSRLVALMNSCPPAVYANESPIHSYAGLDPEPWRDPALDLDEAAAPAPGGP